MSSIAELTALGKELGYEGEDLRRFVSDEQSALRDIRNKERELEREKLEAAREERERERQEKEKEREYDREKSERDRAHEIRLYDMQESLQKQEIEKLKLQKEIKDSPVNTEGSDTEGNQSCGRQLQELTYPGERILSGTAKPIRCPPSIKCYKCGQVGHKASNCLEYAKGSKKNGHAAAGEVVYWTRKGRKGNFKDPVVDINKEVFENDHTELASVASDMPVEEAEKRQTLRFLGTWIQRKSRKSKEEDPSLRSLRDDARTGRAITRDGKGPILPRSSSGNKYILTMVDYATRYPEAIALPSIETERVADALLSFFSRVGIPEEMVTDRGSQFTSQMMDELLLRDLWDKERNEEEVRTTYDYVFNLRERLEETCKLAQEELKKSQDLGLYQFKVLPFGLVNGGPAPATFNKMMRSLFAGLEGALGKELGYEGEDLRRFVSDEQSALRDIRNKERELEREKLEAAREERERERQEKEKEREYDREKSERDRAHEIRLYDMQESLQKQEIEKLKLQKEIKDSPVNTEGSDTEGNIPGATRLEEPTSGAVLTRAGAKEISIYIPKAENVRL
ncbi:uncharacterized protein LOC135195856 [Macrobrachium nipponense]|uniref:uncharacterized protein LOC135195856 n=1 Tax=Macrobrachium nipponense TaxID=159736 RepID=UPI0030C85A27